MKLCSYLFFVFLQNFSVNSFLWSLDKDKECFYIIVDNSDSHFKAIINSENLDQYHLNINIFVYEDEKIYDAILNGSHSVLNVNVHVPKGNSTLCIETLPYKKPPFKPIINISPIISQDHHPVSTNKIEEYNNEISTILENLKYITNESIFAMIIRESHIASNNELISLITKTGLIKISLIIFLLSLQVYLLTSLFESHNKSINKISINTNNENIGEDKQTFIL